MRKPVKVILALAIVAIAALLIRGTGIPIAAKPSYDLKGFGLAWSWETELKDGCISWFAAPSQDFVNVHILSNQHVCETFDLDLPDLQGLSLEYASHSDKIVFLRDAGPVLGGGNPCPFTVSDEEIEVFRKLIMEAKQSANQSIEIPALNKIAVRLKNMDGQNLLTDGFRGCSDRKPSDYRKP